MESVYQHHAFFDYQISRNPWYYRLIAEFLLISYLSSSRLSSISDPYQQPQRAVYVSASPTFAKIIHVLSGPVIFDRHLNCRRRFVIPNNCRHEMRREEEGRKGEVGGEKTRMLSGRHLRRWGGGFVRGEWRGSEGIDNRQGEGRIRGR